MWLFTLKAIKIYSCNRQTLAGDEEFQRGRQRGTKHARLQHQSGTQRSSWLADLPPGCCHKWSASGRTVQRVRKTPRLLKLVQRAEGDKGREWEIGAKVKPKCYNYSRETGPGCLLTCTAVFQLRGQMVSPMTTEATALVAVCIRISCAVLAAARLQSHFERAHRWATSRRGGWVGHKMRTLQEYLPSHRVMSSSHVLVFNREG